MKKSKRVLRAEKLRLVARHAVVNATALPAMQRAELFEGASLLLPKKEAAAARHAAFLIRESERHQASFVHLLFAENPEVQLAAKRKF